MKFLQLACIVLAGLMALGLTTAARTPAHYAPPPLDFALPSLLMLPWY